MSLQYCYCQMREGNRCHLLISNLLKDDTNYCRRHQGCKNPIKEMAAEKARTTVTQKELEPQTVEEKFVNKGKKPKLRKEDAPEPENVPKDLSKYSRKTIDEPEDVPEPEVGPVKLPQKGKTRVSRVDENVETIADEKKTCDDLGGFTNFNNSCYMDSLLYAILHTNHPYIDDYMLNVDLRTLNAPLSNAVKLSDFPELFEVTESIQLFLKKAQKTIHYGHIIKVGPLRRDFKKHDDLRRAQGEKFVKTLWLKSQLSPDDVVTQLNKIFSLPDLTHIKEEAYAVVNPVDLSSAQLLGDDTKESYTSFVLNIHQNEITTYDKKRKIFKMREALTLTELINLRTILTDKSDTPRTIEQRTVISSPILYVNLQRIAGQHVIPEEGLEDVPIAEDIPIIKVKTTIVPDETITLGDKNTMNLVSIIVHIGDASGGHYITYIKCDNDWYCYNDSGFEKLDKIGQFDRLLEMKSSHILENATGFFYV